MERVDPIAGRKPFALSEGEKPIKLRVQGLVSTTDVCCYKMSPKMSLKSLLFDYCNHAGLVYNLEIRFLYEGVILRPEKTAEELGMKDGDVIYAIPRQSNGPLERRSRRRIQKTFISFTTFEEDRKERPLIIIIQNHEKEDVYYKISRSMPLRDVMLDYCKYVVINDFLQTRFVFNDFHLKHLANKTPDELHMKDYDVLYALTCNAAKEIVIFDIEEDEELIFLTMGSLGDQEVYYKTRRDITLHWIKLDYCDRRGFVYEDMGMFSSTDGSRIDETKTPGELKMKDRGVIRVIPLSNHI